MEKQKLDLFTVPHQSTNSSIKTAESLEPMLPSSWNMDSMNSNEKLHEPPQIYNAGIPY